jgi:hypothetical protein
LIEPPLRQQNVTDVEIGLGHPRIEGKGASIKPFGLIEASSTMLLNRGLEEAADVACGS